MANGQGNGGAATMTADQYTKKALDHVWIHSANWQELAEKQGMQVFDRGEGARLYDVYGKEFIEGCAGPWVRRAGPGRREMGAGRAEQAGRLAYVSASNYTARPATALAEEIANVRRGGLIRLFLCSGGTETVESAIKVAKAIQAMR